MRQKWHPEANAHRRGQHLNIYFFLLSLCRNSILSFFSSHVFLDAIFRETRLKYAHHRMELEPCHNTTSQLGNIDVGIHLQFEIIYNIHNHILVFLEVENDTAKHFNASISPLLLPFDLNINLQPKSTEKIFVHSNYIQTYGTYNITTIKMMQREREREIMYHKDMQ